MAISFPVSVPPVGDIVGMQFTMLDAVGVGESPYDFSQETFEHPGKRWAIEVQLSPMFREEAEQWVAWFASLRGRRGTFQLGDPVGVTPRGIATGAPLVKGAAQTGGTLLTDGWTAGQTGILKSGDWVQEGSGASAHLHKVLQDADSNGSGDATLELWPGPRIALADNAPLTVVNTKGVWRLSSNSRGYDIGASSYYGISFSAVEAL